MGNIVQQLAFMAASLARAPFPEQVRGTAEAGFLHGLADAGMV